MTQARYALRTTASADFGCGLPAFQFAGFHFPRYLATMPAGTLEQRKNPVTGGYYHAPTPNNSNGIGFYLGSDSPFDLRYQFADDVVPIRHSGWFCDNDGDQTIRGVVFRLPRGRGFLAGWSMCEGMVSFLDYSPIFDNAEDAAYCADSMAENAAESEREYQSNWEESECDE